MTDSELFELFTSKSGGFSLPFLITLTDGKTELNYVNARNNVVFDGTTYKAEVFQFSANADVLGFFGGGTLEIARTFDVVSLLEQNDHITIKINGVLYNGEAVGLCGYTSRYCKAVFSKSTVKITMEKDDRLSMTFPATVFTAANNQGNA
ncbi:hypothetical protein [uncultured Treponema sp.]|uniref:hypothetical protein n=1 Tax=uncultured Treponema sp. TaxID=162155 RepID=UPI0025F0056B|nr:hypothetical protein [uncultured Treponema sp.]